jgi:hypothetical protein
METDLKNALKELKIENIDEVIRILKEKGLIEEAFKACKSDKLQEFLDKYGRIICRRKPTLGGTTVRKFVFD